MIDLVLVLYLLMLEPREVLRNEPIESNAGATSWESGLDFAVGFGYSPAGTAHPFPDARLHLKELGRVRPHKGAG